MLCRILSFGFALLWVLGCLLVSLGIAQEHNRDGLGLSVLNQETEEEPDSSWQHPIAESKSGLLATLPVKSEVPALLFSLTEPKPPGLSQEEHSTEEETDQIEPRSSQNDRIQNSRSQKYLVPLIALTALVLSLGTALAQIIKGKSK